jgi:hypothetical protein
LALAEARVLAVPPADDERLDPGLVLGPCPEEACPLGRAQPLVTVPRVHVGSERLEVERDLSRSMRAVHDREHPALAGGGTDLVDREDERGRGGDVGDADRPRRGADARSDLVRLADDERRARELPRPRDRAVLVRGRQDLVAGAEVERADRRIQPGGGVRDEDEILAARAEEGGERSQRPGELTRAVVLPPEARERTSREEVGRAALELCLEALVLAEHRLGTGAVAPVVQVRDVRVEEEARAHAAKSPTAARGVPRAPAEPSPGVRLRRGPAGAAARFPR